MEKGTLFKQINMINCVRKYQKNIDNISYLRKKEKV